MNDQTLAAKQQALDAMNARDREIKHALDVAEAEIRERHALIVNLSAERAALKAEYGALYEEVGIELKARAAAEATAETPAPATNRKQKQQHKES